MMLQLCTRLRISDASAACDRSSSANCMRVSAGSADDSMRGRQLKGTDHLRVPYVPVMAGTQPFVAPAAQILQPEG
eukprot:791499-Pelagomonas_calceolata.AAC.1